MLFVPDSMALCRVIFIGIQCNALVPSCSHVELSTRLQPVAEEQGFWKEVFRTDDLTCRKDEQEEEGPTVLLIFTSSTEAFDRCREILGGGDSTDSSRFDLA
jgi:hypothetical protein